VDYWHGKYSIRDEEYDSDHGILVAANLSLCSLRILLHSAALSIEKVLLSASYRFIKVPAHLLRTHYPVYYDHQVNYSSEA